MHPAPGGRWLVVTGLACNNRCVFCAVGPLRQLPPPAAGDLEAALKAGRAAGRDTVGFVGGEPTLDPGLADHVRAARALGYQSVLVQTNGRRFAYGAYARDLAEAGVDALDVSLQGHRAALHEYHTRVPGSFKQTARGITVSKAAGLQVGITSVVTRSSYRHLADLVRLAAHLRADAVHLAYPRALGAAAEVPSRVMPPLPLVEPHLAGAAHAAKRSRLPLLVSGVPGCALPGLFARAVELQGDRGPRAGFTQVAACEGCALRTACPGLSDGYRAAFGERHAVPVASADLDGILRQAERLTRAAGLFAGLGAASPATDLAPPRSLPVAVS